VKKKVVLVYKNIEGKLAEESVWATPEGQYFRLDNIPFYAPGLALNDLIKVEEDEGVLYFDELISASGHSTIQVIFFKENEIERVLKSIENLGCKWEGMKGEPYFSIDVPEDINYLNFREFLDNEAGSGVLDFKEACLAENHIRGTNPI
jgi:hypothetical protein